MKETGIIMSGNHPKKILDGTKIMTRRTRGLEKINKNPDLWIKATPVSHTSLWRFESQDGELLIVKRPYGQAGDRLWVREAFSTYPIHYKADGYILQEGEGMWHPSIFMPRWASRIILEITEVRAERLQEITEDDSTKEGLQATLEETWWQGYREVDMGELGKELMHQQTIGNRPPYWMIEPHRMLNRPDLDAMFSAKNRFRILWDSLNAKRGYGWEFNPWVWVISSKNLEVD